MNHKHAIILPLKENYTHRNFGAVSIWVSLYLKHTKNKKNKSVFNQKKN